LDFKVDGNTVECVTQRVMSWNWDTIPPPTDRPH
jgi:hypothetical protein